jgi:molecular chaperone DnaK (HSP70)
MVEESVEHAFTDLAARRWVESKAQSRQRKVAATHKGLVDAAGELVPETKSQIEIALKHVEALLAAEPAETKPADVKQLQNACAALDEVTRPLADVLMDRAMEALLRQRGLVP